MLAAGAATVTASLAGHATCSTMLCLMRFFADFGASRCRRRPRH
jgi:hypothetical protein